MTKPDAGVDASVMKNYKVHFTAVIKGVAYIAAPSRKEAAQTFRDDEEKQFDQIENFGKFKINKVEEIS